MWETKDLFVFPLHGVTTMALVDSIGRGDKLIRTLSIIKGGKELMLIPSRANKMHKWIII